VIPVVRLSPSEQVVAIRIDDNRWLATNGVLFTDAAVEHWTPMEPARAGVRVVTCPWCGQAGRKLTKSGRIYNHGLPGTFPSVQCKGASRFPSDFVAVADGAA
jgi:hypothetical protein